MDRGDGFYSLNLDDYFVFHDEIRPESFIQTNSLVDYWDGLLVLEVQSLSLKFEGKNCGVCGF